MGKKKSGGTSAPSPRPVTYAQAGVNIDAGNRLVELIKGAAASTQRPGVLSGLGGFGALFQVDRARYQDPVLVACTDGVGTKLKLAFLMNRHETVGIDLVAMSVNDLVVQGAEPLFFLDYFATGRLDPETAATVVAGIASGCRQSGCALIGGETAEMPGFYTPGEYDLAGFAVGVVEKSRIIDGHTIRPGDAVLGLASSGPHSNGYSLIRRLVLGKKGPGLNAPFGHGTLGEALLAPTRIYVKPLLTLMEALPVKGLVHITGGGFWENIPRVLPKNITVELDKRNWPRPLLFDVLQKLGNVSEHEMLRTFNCGIGMVVVVPAEAAEEALQLLTREGETVWRIGATRARQGDEAQVVIHG